MHHGVGNFDPGRETIKYQPANLGFQDFEQIAVLAQIGFGTVNGRGQVPAQIACEFQHLLAGGMAHHQGGRAEDFRRQFRISQKRFEVGLEERSADPELLVIVRGAPGGQQLHPFFGLAARSRGLIGRPYARCQQVERMRFDHQFPQLVDEVRGVAAFGKEYESGLGAELARSQGERTEGSGREVVAALPQRARQNENRIGAAHFGEHRDGFGTRSREVHQRPAGMMRARKAHRLHQRMFDQRHTHASAGIKQKRESSFRKTTFLNTLPQQLSHQFTGAGMRGMPFDNDWISRGQCRGRVSAGH